MNAELLRRWAPRLLLAGVFLLFSVEKLGADPAEFALAIYNYQMLPDVVINPMALFLPWLEVWVALALLFAPRLRTAAWAWAGFLLLIFTVAKISAMARGLDISCGCHAVGPDAKPISIYDVAMNLLLLAVCAYGWRADGTRRAQTTAEKQSSSSV